MSTPDINSYSQLIRDALVARLKKIPTFSSIKKWGEDSHAHQIQPNDLPYFGVYELEGIGLPDGDANHGSPRFIEDVKIGFSIFIQNIKETDSRINLDAARWTVMNYLRQPQWHTFKEVLIFDEVLNKAVPLRIESVTRIHWRYSFNNNAIDNETPIAELQMDWTLRYRSTFEPIIPDELERIRITVAYPWPYDPNAEEPFKVNYELESQ